MRTLFLDDDPRRASAFAAIRPDMVWARTAEECLRLLAEPWDEVRLDHDLGGETFVDPDRDDCGMAIVRRLAEGGHGHLSGTRFVVHTHNANAACVMALHLKLMGFRVEVEPFGSRPSAVPLPTRDESPREVGWRRRLLRWLGGRSG